MSGTITVGDKILASHDNVSGKLSMSGDVVFPAGRIKFLGKASGGSTSTYSTSLVFGEAVQLPTIPSTNNKILIVCDVGGRVEHNADGGYWIFCLKSDSTIPTSYSSLDVINSTNFSTLMYPSNNYYFEYGINPSGTGITETYRWEMKGNSRSDFLFNGSSELVSGSNLYFYYAFLNRTGSGAYTQVFGYIHSITLYEIEV